MKTEVAQIASGGGSKTTPFTPVAPGLHQMPILHEKSITYFG